jgi:hypothetical protein
MFALRYINDSVSIPEVIFSAAQVQNDTIDVRISRKKKGYAGHSIIGLQQVNKGIAPAPVKQSSITDRET